MRIALGIILATVVAIATPRDSRAEAVRPAGVFVTLTQVADADERAAHIDRIRSRLSACPALASQHVDVNVTRLSWITAGASVELQLELAVVISNAKNEVVAIANQTAKLTLAKSRFREGKLPSLRREVIDDAIGELVAKLRRANGRSV